MHLLRGNSPQFANGRVISGGSAPFSPADLTNLHLWLDASDASTITESGGAVSQWDDKSGNGYHATQGTGSFQPTTGTRTVNSLNALDFDGSDDCLILPSGAFSIADSNNTVFCLAKTDNASQQFQHIYSGADSGSGRFRVFVNPTAGQDVNYSNSSSGTSAVVTRTTDVNPHIYHSYRDGSSLGANVDGGAYTTAAASGVTLTNFRIGSFATGSSNINGLICEIIIYNSKLTVSERNQVGSYLEGKWGATWAAVS